MRKELFLLIVLLVMSFSSCQSEAKETKTLANYSNGEQRHFGWIVYELYDYLMYFGIVVVVTVIVYFVIIIIRANRNRNQLQVIPQGTSPLIQNQAYYVAINATPYCGLCNQLIQPPIQTNQIPNPEMIMQCGHSFHFNCIAAYLQTKNSCPLCKTVILLDPVVPPQMPQNSLPVNINQNNEANYMAPGASILDLNKKIDN